MSKRWRLFSRKETIVLSRPDDGSEGELHRWRLIETPLGGIMLHCHHGPDPGRVLHDHPWPFAALVLRGGYSEEVAEARNAPLIASIADAYPDTATYGVQHERGLGSLHVIPLTHAHRIVRLHRSPTWTLVLHGPRRRSWGFYPASGYIGEKRVDWERIDLIGASFGGAVGGVPEAPQSQNATKEA